MSRPEHLNCVNTVEGIRRINEEQREYDKDPEQYERREREIKEEREREQEQERQDYLEQEKILEDNEQNYG
jgi:hypothetical protein